MKHKSKQNKGPAKPKINAKTWARAAFKDLRDTGAATITTYSEHYISSMYRSHIIIPKGTTLKLVPHDYDFEHEYKAILGVMKNKALLFGATDKDGRRYTLDGQQLYGSMVKPIAGVLF